ncbi:MAG: TonB-dependent receptor [Pseudomonadota bacterium]
MKRLSMLCAAVAAVLSPAFAANTETPVVVTATRLDDVTRLPASITVITAEEIHRTPAKTLPELLSLEAGVFNRDLYGNQAARAKIDIRGFGAASSENVLILLDGRRLNDIDMSAVDFTSIPLGMIERVEITRGVGAVLYGDGAVGGVVNIITRQPGRAGRKGQAAFAAGTYNTRRIEANIEQGNGSTSFHLAAQGLHSDGYRVNNELDQGTLQADLRFAASGRESFLKFGADRYKVGLPAHRQVDASANVDLLSTDRRGATTPNDYSKRDGFHVSGGTTLFLPGNSQLILDVGYREKQDKASLSSFLDTTLAGWSFTPRLKTGSSVWGLPGSAVAGVDYFVSTYDSDRANNEAAAATPIHRLAIRQTSIAVYAQDTAELRPGTHFTLGARHQQVSSRARDTFNASAPGAAFDGGATDKDDGETEDAYEVGLRHALNDTLSWFGRYGRSFRIATVDEIFSTFPGQFTFLLPQTARTLETGLAYRQGDVRLEASVYRMNLKNEIHYDPNTFANVNLDPTRRRGVELSAGWQAASRLALKASYAYTEARFTSGSYSGNEVPLVPRRTASLALDWKAAAWWGLSATARHVGDKRFDNDQTNTFSQKIPAYAMVDLKWYGQAQGWTLEAAVNNAFDRKAYDYGIRSTSSSTRYNAYPLPERSYTLTLRKEL